MGWSTRYGILFLAGIAASLVAWRWDAARRNPWFRHGGLAVFVGLLGFAVASRDVVCAYDRRHHRRRHHLCHAPSRLATGRVVKGPHPPESGRW